MPLSLDTTAASVSPLELRIEIGRDGEGARTYSMVYRGVVFNAAGEPLSRKSGNAVPFLTAAQVTAMKGVADALADQWEALVP